MTRCWGSQPVLPLAEPLSSSAARKAWLTNGLSGPAHLSQSAGAIAVMSVSTRSVTCSESGISSQIGGSVDREKRFYLDCGIARQAGHADSGTGMLAGLAQNVGDQVRGAVHHQMLLDEIRRRGDA